jgi:hypothetical protein
MPFDWREYLEVARFLQGQLGAGFSAEAGWRAAIGRPYYAAYGHALCYARDHLGFVPRRRLEERAQDHGLLRAHLHQRRRQRVSNHLGRLRDWRNVCDYEDDPPPGFDFAVTAADAIAAAEYVISALPPPASPSAAGS